MKAELVRGWIITRRYWFRTLIGMFISYGLLMMLIIGFMSNKETITSGIAHNFADTNRATNYVLGFLIGLFAFGIVGMFTQGLQQMAQSGVLEQLCMSPHGLITNFLARSTVTAISSILSCTLLLFLISKSISGNLYFLPAQVFSLLGLTFIDLIGFGFMAGGLVLVFKQVGQVAVLVRMALIGLALFAQQSTFEGQPILQGILHIMPVTDAAICLKHVLIFNELVPDGAGGTIHVPLFQFPNFYFLMVNAAVWTLLGILCFRLMENWSRDKGTLGAY